MVDERGGRLRGGRAVRRTALTVATACLAVGSLVMVGVSAPSRAGAAGPGTEPVGGRLGAVPPGATRMGPAPATTTLPMVVTLQPRDPAALATAVKGVSTPGSPDYRHFLTPAQFAAEYGATPSAIAQVISALRSAGLKVGSPSSIGLSIPVSGSVAAVQSAFSTQVSQYRLPSGRTGYDVRSRPELPDSVAPLVQSVLGLDTLSPPQPTTSVPQAAPGVAHPDATAQAAPASVAGQPAPQGPSCTDAIDSVESGFGALDADDLAQAYSFDPLYAAGDYGSGSTIALVELSGAGYLPSDISTFAGCYGIALGGGQVTEKALDGGGATGFDTGESELDIETALSLAPQADIEVYEGGTSDDLYNVFNQIVNDDTAKIVSSSWTNGCEAYVGQSLQSSENTLFLAAALEGQSIFAATGDEGSEGCNLNSAFGAPTGSDPVAQAVDPSTGTLYVADETSGTVTVDSEGSASNPSGFSTSASVTTGPGSDPDAVALDPSLGKVFVADGGTSSLTVLSTSSCNASTTTGCGTPTQVPSGGHLSTPTSLAVNGSTLYVGNSNGTMAVYSAVTNTYVTTVTLLPGTVPSDIAVDTANGGVVYVADGASGRNRIEWLSASTCNATTVSGCSSTPTAVGVGNDPVSMAVDDSVGSLYVADAGTNGGISVMGLAAHTLTATISTGSPAVAGIDGTGLVQSIGLSPDGHEVLAVLTGLTFPGDLMATINPLTNAITATVNLQIASDTVGQLVSDGTLDDVWVTDQSTGRDVVQNLKLAVTDPASQPFVTAVGGTSVTALGPAPTESVWNNQLLYAEGAGGGGISQSFTMPGYQQGLGEVVGSSGTPCGNTGGDCREIPDVSADANPSTGYVVYDTVNFSSINGGWVAIGGTSAAAPLWAAVLAVASSADGAGTAYGALNPALYALAQQSPGTYFNDVTTGNNDDSATNGGQYPAMVGYDMATGLGTPDVAALATGLHAVPLDVAVSGSQTYGGFPTFSGFANFSGLGTSPPGVSVNTAALSCTELNTSTPISPALPAGSDTITTSSCSGVTLTGPDAANYTVVYTAAPGDFVVNPAPVDVAVSGHQTYGGGPTFSGAANPPSGVTVSTAGLSCSEVNFAARIVPTLGAGSDTIDTSSCSGATLSGPDAPDFTVAYTATGGDFLVSPAPLTITASSATMTSGTTPPAVTASYSGFVNSQGPSVLTGTLTCSAGASSASPPGTYASSCTGVSDPNYAITFVGGTTTVVGSGPHGYWLVGSDGGIFTFGNALFYGSTGNLVLNRPVVGITPTANRGGYWLVASDGGIFSFGNAGFYGSIPGLGLSPAGSGLPHSLNAPVVGMVPSSDGGGYFMVASDGGVFAFGDARFEGSCPGIGGCVGAAVAVVPDASGNGYWVVTQVGAVYTFGDAQYYGAPGNQGSPVTSAVRTPDGRGYWVLLANGDVDAYGDAIPMGNVPAGSVGGLNPATAIFTDSDGGGYWVADAQGAVWSFGDAPNDGSMLGTRLNGAIIAATGF